MFKGFDKVTGEFTTIYNSREMEIIKTLSDIEKHDADVCKGCSCEDRMCCEIYLDRKRWVTSDELFSHEYGDPMYDEEERHFENYLNHLIEDCEYEEFDVPKEKCDKCDARFWCDERKEN